ncbi:hypothetical protein Taro_005437 [Colocasia esculenta]|uniref:CBS domain-containing protein n=1 Tax=Colocasia esculenta TaxID=4460 RepID=A0A843TXV9_COLES|nr:hypothetical protein [Colocasia esculenta]
MATACGSLHLAHGSLLLRHTSPPRGAATRPLGLVTGGSTLSSHLPRRNGGERCETGGRRGWRTAPAGAIADNRVDLDDNPAGIISGEWPENFSLLSYDDLRVYLETQIVDDEMRPALLGEVMSTTIRAATPDQTLEEIDHHFEFVSGMPVVDHELRCIGVISKKDQNKAIAGLKSKVGEVMSSPAVTISPEKTIMDAAALMLKKKIHRIPVLNREGQVIGMVTRTDILEALETVFV